MNLADDGMPLGSTETYDVAKEHVFYGLSQFRYVHTVEEVGVQPRDQRTQLIDVSERQSLQKQTWRKQTVPKVHLQRIRPPKPAFGQSDWLLYPIQHPFCVYIL